MLRIHFSTEDLGRVQLAAGPDPAWETLLSLHALATRHKDPTLLRWRTRTRAALTPQTAHLMRLAPPRGYSPDFLTPAAGVTGIDEAIDAVQSTPRARLRADLGLLAEEHRLPSWTGPLAAGRPGALRGLGTALRHYSRQALAPYWADIRSAVEADRTARARQFLAGGAEHLLARLHPQVRWQAPVLHVAYPVERDLHLHGRGLRLVPAYFCRGTPLSLRDSSLRPVLVYPVSGSLARRDTPTGCEALARLLGATRAQALRAIAGPDQSTANDLARHLGISPASVSEHATVLRNAGLIRSLRVRNTIRHTITPLGAELLGHASAS